MQILFKSNYKCPVNIRMFNIFTYQGNANQNYIEIVSHPNQNGYHQNNNKNQQILARMGGLR
jgi:hypothetical protein